MPVAIDEAFQEGASHRGINVPHDHGRDVLLARL
jgi:hypothetical protein